MALYLSQLMLNPSSREVRSDIQDCQALHRRLMNAFETVLSSEARKALGVLYHLDVKENPLRIILLVQSAVPPDWCCLPDAYCLVNGIGQKDVSVLLDRLHEQDRYRFQLYANPTKKVGGSLKEERMTGTKTHSKRVLLPAEEQIPWLGRQGEKFGFHLLGDPIIIKSSSVYGHKRDQSGTMRHEGILFSGVLQVTDVGRFSSCIRDGIGAGKAYGLGMLQLLGRIG